MKLIADKINIVESESAALTLISEQQKNHTVSVVSFINAHAYTLAQSSPEFQYTLMQSDVLFRDGIGLKILLKSYGLDCGYNANGTDLIPRVLEKLKHLKICFIGTESPYIDDAMAISKQQDINVVAQMNGFQDFNTMQLFVEKHQPDLLILGMGMPKQELFSLQLKKNYKLPLVVINGGAIFDFISGRFNRAPQFYRQYGLEWLYRLANEPIRLFKRYVIGIPKFMFILWTHKFKERSD